MRKLLSTTNNQHGFILPYVLFITTLALILITAHIHSYQLGIEITDRYVQQLKMETLFQMGRERIKTDIDEIAVPGTLNYNFPYGEVRIEVQEIEQNNYELFFTITTNSNNHIYAIKNILEVEENLTE
ncbi:hypothetical protein ACFOUV_03100 [Oceanobacillus longus]|uniref:ComG operon protein 7 n=1 Tax=Oceanobacillus longus TaxID=930120 RepID=A0ABV8GXA5_9BACI